jgi:transcriptional regulator with XRE-family HTH domain
MSKTLRRKGRPADVQPPTHVSAGTELDWLDHYRESDTDFKKKVDDRLNQLRDWLTKKLVSIRRDEVGISQSELARRARVGQPYLARLEKGRIKNPELQTLARIATALDMDLTVALTSRNARSITEDALPEEVVLRCIETVGTDCEMRPQTSLKDEAGPRRSSERMAKPSKTQEVNSSVPRPRVRRRLKTGRQ